MSDRFYFRAWTGTLMLSDVAACNGEYVRADWSECPDFILMQCTGIKDRNGELIYEGDIVKNYYFKDGVVDTVIFDNEYACFRLKNDNHSEIINCEVIGNIYQNPELLEKVDRINNIAQTQQTLDQMTESNKHLKSESNSIEIEEDYLVELLETINNLCETNKALQDKFELSQKLIGVLQEKLRLF